MGTISYEYDARGQRTQMNPAGDASVFYEYDAASRPTQVAQGGQVADLQYDALGRRRRLILPNGVSTKYQYDVASRVTELIYGTALGTLGNLTYKYDAGGKRTRIGGSFARTLLPDPVSLTSYNSANRQLTFGSTSQTFDPNGNLLVRTDGAGITNYTWDARNRLVAISGPTGTSSFRYDAFGRRIEKTMNGSTTTFQYDGPRIIREIGPTGEVVYLRTLEVDEILARTDATGTTLFFLTDAIGSTVALTTTAGVLGDQYTYEAFGKTQSGGAGTSNRFKFTGREEDETGLYYYRARYYDPVRSRFIQEDPFGQNLIKFYAGDTNLYRYAANSPVNLIDPTGEGPVLLGACIAGLVIDGDHTLKTVYDLANEEKKIIDRIRELRSKLSEGPYPTDEDLKIEEEIEELQRRGIKIADEKSRAYGRGALFGLPVAILCAAAVEIPF